MSVERYLLTFMPANKMNHERADRVRLCVIDTIKMMGGRARYSDIKARAKLRGKPLADKQVSKGLRDGQETGEIKADKIWGQGSRPMSYYSLTGKRLLAVSNEIPDRVMSKPRIVLQRTRRYEGAGGTRGSRIMKVAAPSD